MASALVPPCVCGMVMLVVTHISKHISSSLNVGQLSPMFLRSHTAPPRAPPPLYTTQRNTSRSTRARCENGERGAQMGCCLGRAAMHPLRPRPQLVASVTIYLSPGSTTTTTSGSLT